MTMISVLSGDNVGDALNNDGHNSFGIVQYIYIYIYIYTQKVK